MFFKEVLLIAREYAAHSAAVMRKGILYLHTMYSAVCAKFENWQLGSNTRTVTALTLILPICIAVYVVYWVPPQTPYEKTFVTISEGSSVDMALKQLTDAGVISHPLPLRLLLLLTRTDDSLFAGDYYFSEPTTVYSVYTRITTGAFGLKAIRFLVREGDTVEKIAARCEELLFACSAQSFIEHGERLEGYLFPDTYFVRPNISEADLLTLLSNTLYEKIADHAQAIQTSGFSLHELLTMASIIEKEEHEDADRKLISGVIRNRLNIGMALQVDATFLYIMGKGSHQLSRKDLALDSPYNTYVYTGLPPGPIGSPSLSAILAAIYPTDNPYIFYLADRHGTTYYSKTYQEHLIKKAKYIDAFR